ncbi:hypothetical protein [Thalassoroseus pseudoceratinae]|uniref:hypothetical protein n=1 Tax=Thalassoroseus pseudoceratinae TaxID=2713176 RepID=UPI00141F05B3|nr:hypothetical protein [Thalassoroseus pseudoceratinae]
MVCYQSTWFRQGRFELILYGLLAVAAVWPMPKSLTTVLPLGTEPVETVPLFNLWTMWWNADRAAEGFYDYWQSPIFFPAADTFAFSEPQPTTLVVAPLIWMMDTPIAAYNCYLLLALSLNGWSSFRLLRRLEVGWAAAFTGGAMVLLLPFVHWQLGVLQLVPIFGIVWTIHALVDIAHGPNWRNGLRLGLSVAVTYFLCNHYGLFLCLLLVPTTPWLLGRKSFDWRAWGMILFGATICVALIGPMVWTQLEVMHRHDWKRSHELIETLSARPSDLLVPPWKPMSPLPAELVTPREWPWKLFPGIVKTVLAVVGIFGGLWKSQWRTATVFLLSFGVLAELLALGPFLKINGVQPYWWLFEHVPGIAQVRSVYRFNVFAQLALCFLAAIGVQTLCVEFWCRSQERSWGKFGLVVTTCSALVLGGWAAAELWPPCQRLHVVTSPEVHRKWIDWVKDNTRSDAIVCGMPFVKGTRAEDYAPEAQWMLHGMLHHRRMTNGYSGFFPRSFKRLKGDLSAFPNRHGFEALAKLGVKWLIVDSTKMPTVQLMSVPGIRNYLRLDFWDEDAGIAIYRLLK